MKGRGAPVEVGIYLEEEKQDGSAGNGTGNWPCSILVRGPGYNNETETEVAILASEGHKDQFVDFLSFSSYIKGIFGWNGREFPLGKNAMENVADIRMG